MIEYRAVPGFPGYEVGADGSVRSYFVRGFGSIIGTIPHFLKLMPNNKTGYLTVHVRMPDRRRRKMEVHNFVLFAFIGPRPDGMLARHLNGNRLDNRVENLIWGTPLENQQDSIQHGTKNAQKAKVRKFSPNDIAQIRAMKTSGMSGMKIAQHFDCSFQTIYKIISRQRYSDV